MAGLLPPRGGRARRRSGGPERRCRNGGASRRHVRMVRSAGWRRARSRVGRSHRRRRPHVTRVLHLVAVPWESTDGVARACQELVRRLDGCEHVLVADRDPGFARDAFAEVRVVPGWTPQMPWRGAFRRAFEVLVPDVVHVHGGELAPLLAYAPVFAGTAIVASCYAATPTAAGLDRAQRREHRANVSVTRAWATRLGGR